jgi:hypothetical protein
MPKQPFYHSASILFTAIDEELTRDEVTEIFRKIKKDKRIVINSIECESVNAEPGDPHDLD